VRALERKDVEKASALLEKHILNTAQDIAQKWQTKAQQPKGRGQTRRP
jgi:DNA-binding GntR family transcriptional regulator